MRISREFRVCSYDLRFRFDNKDGRGTCYCNKCGPGDGVQLVMMKTGWPLRQAAEKIREVLPNADEHRPKPTLSEERRLPALRDPWKASKQIGRAACGERGDHEGDDLGGPRSLKTKKI